MTEIKCSRCENTTKNGSSFKLDINANLICEDCAEKAIKISTHALIAGHHFYSHAEHGNDEFSTGYFKQRSQAEQRCIEMIKAFQSANVWPKDVAIVEN